MGDNAATLGPATCDGCRQRIALGVACTVTVIESAGTEFRRIALGDETAGWWVGREPDDECDDCSVRCSQLHHLSCDMEQCPPCFDQLLGCGCLSGRFRDEDRICDDERSLGVDRGVARGEVRFLPRSAEGAGCAAEVGGSMADVPLIPVATRFNNPIGIDYHEPSDQVVISVNHPNGTPNNFEPVARDGTRTPFSTLSGSTDEVKIGAIRSGPHQGGFHASGELFTSTGTPGFIARISPDGNTVQHPWIALRNEKGLVVGSSRNATECSVATSS